MQQDKIITTVFGPGGFIMAGISRLVFAVADGANPVGINPQFCQRFAGGQRTAFAEGTIIFFSTAFIAIAFDQQFGIGISVKRGGDGLDARLFAVTNDGAVVGKMNGVSSQGITVLVKLADIPVLVLGNAL